MNRIPIFTNYHSDEYGTYKYKNQFIRYKEPSVTHEQDRCKHKSNLADMTKLPTESVRRVLDFLDGVKYVCKSKIEVIAEKIYLIVPEAAELSGDFFGQVDKPSFF